MTYQLYSFALIIPKLKSGHAFTLVYK